MPTLREINGESCQRSGFRSNVSIIAALLLLMVTRQIVAQPLQRPETSVPKRGIHQATAALLVPIPILDITKAVPLQRKLREPGSVAFDQVPLNEAVHELSRQFGVNVLVDTSRLDEASIQPDVLVTCSETNVPLGTLLDRICRPLELAWCLRGEVILITAEDRQNPEIVTELYPVYDLIEGEYQAKLDSIVEAINKEVLPESWKGPMQRGHIFSIRRLGILAISQTREGHAAAFDFLAKLRQQAVPSGAPAIDWQATKVAGLESIARDQAKIFTPDVALGVTEEDLRIQRQLDQIASFDIEEMPLGEWARTLRLEHKLPLRLEAKWLEEASVTPDTPISISVQNVSLRQALRIVLGQFDLTYYVDGEIFIGPVGCPSARTSLFPVADLAEATQEPGVVDLEWLVTLLHSNLQPLSWDDNGVPENISFHGVTRSLIVSHYAGELQKTRELLTALRLAHQRLQQWQRSGTVATERAELESELVRTMSLGERSGVEGPSLAPISLDLEQPWPKAAEQLDTRISAEIPSMPLNELMAYLQKEHGVSIVFDSSLEEEGIDLASDASLEVRDVPLKTALRTALSKHDLAYEIVGGTVVIRAAEEVALKFTTMAHPAQDLVTGNEHIAYVELAKLVMELAWRDSWDEAGGPARMTVFPKAGTLVAYQSIGGQEAVQQVLAALRRAKAISDAQTVHDGDAANHAAEKSATEKPDR